MRVRDSNGRAGVFHPSQIRNMRRELRRGDIPAETEAQREERAYEIIQRNAAQSDDDTHLQQEG
ncbi:hypothetical protein [Mesorhizobium koreense]|uniref:hypothetical protein n=1 Tax=Mesorhizobium koreense TaxID=3074855 RepID=UPI00287B78B3|nr:hypothetical protein [Mesorhizobium sp. WR6]